MSETLPIFDRRILVDTKDEKACNLGCKFCFATATHEFYRARAAKGVIDLVTAKERIEETLRTVGDSVHSINSSCSQELFLDEQFGINKIQWLAQFGTNVSFSTRIALSEATLDALRNIDQRMRESRKKLLVLTSIITNKQRTDLEGKTSTPQDRIRTLQGLRNRDIAAGVLMRPILPEGLLPTTEITNLIDAVKDITPVLTIGREFMFTDSIGSRLGIARTDPDIAPHIRGESVGLGFVGSDNNWHRYVDPRIPELVEFGRDKKIPTFTSTREALELLSTL